MKTKRTSTSNLRKAKPGDLVIVPMGMYFPHAIVIESVHTDEDGQIIGTGKTIPMDGCSEWRLNEIMSICLGWM